MAKPLPTNNGQFEIPHIKIKLNNAGNADRLHMSAQVMEGKALKLLKMVKEDFKKMKIES